MHIIDQFCVYGDIIMGVFGFIFSVSGETKHFECIEKVVIPYS